MQACRQWRKQGMDIPLCNLTNRHYSRPVTGCLGTLLIFLPFVFRLSKCKVNRVDAVLTRSHAGSLQMSRGCFNSFWQVNQRSRWSAGLNGKGLLITGQVGTSWGKNSDWPLIGMKSNSKCNEAECVLRGQLEDIWGLKWLSNLEKDCRICDFL